MATRQLTRSLFTKFSLFSSSISSVHRVRPLSAAAISAFRRLPPVASLRGYSTRTTSPHFLDWDFEHWRVIMREPEGDPTRDEIIDSYVKTLATVVGSEEEARMKIYSVYTRYYFAFGALGSFELSKLEELPRVLAVYPDVYEDDRNKTYGGEPFIDGKAGPYDPKYYEYWRRRDRKDRRDRRKA